MAFEDMASLIVVRNVVGELQPKRTLAASRGFLAAARLFCSKVRLKSKSNYKRGGIGSQSHGSII